MSLLNCRFLDVANFKGKMNISYHFSLMPLNIDSKHRQK